MTIEEREKNVDAIEALAEAILDEIASYRVSATTADELLTIRTIDDILDTIRAEAKALYRAVEGQGIIFI